MVGDERCICIVFFGILFISVMRRRLMQIMIVFTFSNFIMPSYLIANDELPSLHCASPRFLYSLLAMCLFA